MDYLVIWIKCSSGWEDISHLSFFQAQQPLLGMELQEKEKEKDKKYLGKMFRKNPKIKGVYLVFNRPMFPSYRNQSVDSQSKSTDWFLYHGNIDR